MAEWLELWCLLAGNLYPHKIGLWENFEESVPALMRQSFAIHRDDMYFIVKVQHTTDI